MKYEPPDPDTDAVDAAVLAELRALAAAKGLHFVGVASDLYQTTLIRICARAKAEGLEASALLEALTRLFSALDGAAVVEAGRLRAKRAGAHGKN
jgi:hypothetical protein